MGQTDRRTDKRADGLRHCLMPPCGWEHKAIVHGEMKSIARSDWDVRMRLWGCKVISISMKSTRQRNRRDHTGPISRDAKSNNCPKWFGKTPHRRRSPTFVQSLFYSGQVPCSVKIAPSRGALDTNLIRGSFGPREYAPKQDHDRFDRFCRASQHRAKRHRPRYMSRL